ncbi:MAG: DNA polymerase/3'-5' exonuclease PolX [Candidatus Promineifilaceae bacterium]|nr:DNA polymerase/3'-5' exonuclease PolX [Candidatus Promineifilaceae bacterium]
MPVHNVEVARIFSLIADLLAIEEANEFRIRAYRQAARTIRDYPRPMADLVDDGESLAELPDIGEDLAGKIREIVRTGELQQLTEIKQRTPLSLTELLKFDGLGPKRTSQLYQELDITSPAELEAALENERLQALEGFGPKLIQRLRRQLAEGLPDATRTPLSEAEELAGSLVDYLRAKQGVGQVKVAGSYRRRQETVGDLDVLVTGEPSQAIIEQFVAYEDVDEVLSQGETRSTVTFRTGLRVDLRVVAPESYGAALFYFTGSKEHNIALRDMAVERGLKLNEYGLFREDERLVGETEEGLYAHFGLAYIVPELREDRGELAAAREQCLPTLITEDDIRGDLQVHTTASDGRDTIEEMARAARARGLNYVAISDHSPRVAIVDGLDADALRRQMAAIDRLNDELDDITVLKAVEVDILEDGTLDLPDDVLAELDLCICAVHSGFDLSRQVQTERIIRAMDNPHVNILAHPTGRRIGHRPGYDLDLERLMKAALERGCFLEINAQPEHLDLDDVQAKMAREMGLTLAINTDAHSTTELDFMRYGVYQARRGWLEPEDVLNTYPLSRLRQLLSR